MFRKAQLACILFLFVYVQSGPVKKPKIASRSYPCFDHQGSPKKPIPIGAPWETDKCHLSTCIGVGIIMIRTCAVPGITCGPGQYLKQKSKPGSKGDCCKCEKLPWLVHPRKRAGGSGYMNFVFKELTLGNQRQRHDVYMERKCLWNVTEAVSNCIK